MTKLRPAYVMATRRVPAGSVMSCETGTAPPSEYTASMTVGGCSSRESDSRRGFTIASPLAVAKASEPSARRVAAGPEAPLACALSMPSASSNNA